MEEKRVQIHRIATADKSRIFVDRGQEFEDINFYTNLAHQDAVDFSVHLYVTIDERPKPGEWYLVEPFGKNTGYIPQSVACMDEGEEEDAIKFDARKIVATTDLKLKYKCDGCKRSENVDTVYTCSCEFLPSLTTKFQKLYASLNGIDFGTVFFDHKYESWDNRFDFDVVPVTDSSTNTITIHQIKENWSKEEIPQLVVDILNKLNEDQANIPDDADLLKYVSDYIK